MQKLLYVVPHLSTGGMPQYLLKQIEEFKDHFEIHVCEVSFYGKEFVIQRNRIQKLAELHAIYGSQDKLPGIIKRVQPNIVHFQELPEAFLDDKIAAQIFRKDRKFTIITTTHSSEAEPASLRHIPDGFMLVSKWSQNRFKEVYDLPCHLWEYPIEQKKKQTDFARELLKFDPKKFHVLNVGLFTPGKNQREIIEVARELIKKKVHFHFVGNTADNFSSYWIPLKEKLPENCTIYGERGDVDLFYHASDMLYFSSTFELNPLVVKEALGYKLPIIMRKLTTYLDEYDNNPYISFIKNQSEALEYLNKKLK